MTEHHPTPAFLPCAALLCASLCGAASLLAAPAQAATPGTWTFRVLLGDSDIGEHRFVLHEQDGQRTMRIAAVFAVKLLGLTVYRYRHEATEQWAGNCLARLDAQTDDNGTRLQVAARPAGERRLQVESSQGSAELGPCVMSFAYWNPAMLQQSALLNSQTGKLEAVRIRALGETSIPVRGQAQPARHYAIEGLEQPIELWYSLQGEWLALQSTVAGGRRLRYVLQ
jgi:hypothetical protein